MARVYTTLASSCPGDADCPGYVAPGSTEYTQSLQDELAALYTSTTAATTAAATAAAPAAAQTFAQWIQAHQTAVLTATAGLFVLAMFGGMGARR